MKGINLNKKLILFIIASIVSLGLIILVFTIKFTNPYKPSFYSYSAYADAATMRDINKSYTYKEYATAKDFEYAFENNKAIAGVTSDYSIISLINNGKIAPIRKQVQEINKLENPWESYWSETSVEQMNSYNNFITKETQEKLNVEYPEYKEEANGNNYVFKFSDFVVPYFINDRVIAIDTKKVLGKINITDINNEFKFDTIHPTLVEALQKIDKEASNDIKIQWTKNERENVSMGSTKNDPKNQWSTKIDENNYEELLNNFVFMVEEGTKAKISDVKKNLFDSDSDIILNNLINPASKINVAIIYNGDALDAYYGHDNFKDIEDGDRVRIVRTKYTLRILDCFVVSSSINKKERYNLLKDFNKTLFNGMFFSIEDFEKNENPFEIEGMMRIFDYVNYTPAAKNIDQYVYENYFKDEEGKQDEIARSIYKVSTTNEKDGIYVKSLEPIKKDVLSKLALDFQKKLNGY